MSIIKWLKSIFNKDLERGKVFIMKEHQGWGNSIQWLDWPKMKVYGCLMSRPNIGDILVAEFTGGKVVEFQFISVERCRDPHDMFFADVKLLQEVV